MTRRGCIAPFLLYVAGLSVLTLTPSSDINPLRENWVPFQSSWPTLVNAWNVLLHPEYMRYLDDGGLIQIVGNLVLFIPVGWLLPCVTGRQISTAGLVMLSALVSLTIEVTQLNVVPGRMASIDDVIFNTLSALIGAKTSNLFWRALGRRRHAPGGTQPGAPRRS
jgi:glycopeptide antibiotics resistance protein